MKLIDSAVRTLHLPRGVPDKVWFDDELGGFGICEAGIHGHGLASLEYPRYRHHAKGADVGALKAIGDEFRAGMVFAMNIDLFDPKWRNGETGCVFAETIVITDDGARRLHSFPTEFQRVAV